MIYLIYTAKQYTEAKEILYFLMEEKNLAVSSENENSFILNADSRINQDAAIVLISDAAVKDEKWRKIVQKLSEEVRIIPVNYTKYVDYTDPELIPEKIKELNYIHANEKYLKNIWDCLIVEKNFYDIKSMILSSRNVWIFSKFSTDFLLTDRKEVKTYLSIFQKKLSEEEDAYLREEILEIIDYLTISLQYAKILWREKIFNYVKQVIGAVVLIICFIMLFVIYKRITHSHYSTVMGIETYEETAPIGSIYLVDGLKSPVISDQVKLEMYNKLSDYLNLNWYNTPIGINYMWGLNDAQIASDERYIWSANEKGNITKWDTYTGEIVEQEKVSSRPLAAMAFSGEDSFFATVDADGYIYKKNNGKSWEKSKEYYDIPYAKGTDLICDGNQGVVAIAGSNGILYYFDCVTGFNLLWTGRYDKIFCSEISSGGLEAVVCKDDTLYDIYIKTDGTVDEIPIPISWYGSCSMDILDGVIVMADQYFQIVTWSRKNPEKINEAGVVLSQPDQLCFFNEQVIVYSDRNTGTHLYDLERRLDLGRILRNVVSVSSLSVCQNTVMASSSGWRVWHTENVELLLPAEQINKEEIVTVYKEKEMSSDGMIQHVFIESEYIIRAALYSNEKEEILTIDGANRFLTGTSQRDMSLVEDEHINHYIDSPVSFIGKPTVVGITNKGEVLLVGSSDGAFSELIFTETEAYIRGAQLNIPSRAGIVAIYQMEDCYYLEDATGTFWKVRIGYRAVTEDGAIAAVKDKLHYAIADEDIYKKVSRDTIKALDVKIMPGSDGKEWQ